MILTPTAVRELLDEQSVVLRLTVHELRRPLGVVDGYLSLMRDGSLGSAAEQEQVGGALLAMAGAVEEMAALVDGLAAVARLQDRPGSTGRRPCRLGPVIASAVAALDLEARSRRVCVDYGGADVEADIDPDRLRVAVVNLLGNAIQHSPVSSTVTVTTVAQRDAVAIVVADQGSGVDPVDVERVFDPWYQGSTAPAGLGLGLWIARKVVGWYGGRVTLDSRPGQGSRFTILLPCSRSAGPDATAATAR